MITSSTPFLHRRTKANKVILYSNLSSRPLHVCVCVCSLIQCLLSRLGSRFFLFGELLRIVTAIPSFLLSYSSYSIRTFLLLFWITHLLFILLSSFPHFFLSAQFYFLSSLYYPTFMAFFLLLLHPAIINPYTPT